MRGADDSQHAALALRAGGLRATGARRTLLAYLARRRQHLTAGEIADGLRRAGARVGVATVYQNLQTLSDRGLLRRFAGPDGLMRYDLNLSAHHHLVCERCGRIADVGLAGRAPIRPVSVGGGSLRGWRVRQHQVEFLGLCPDCQRPARRSHRPGATKSR
jgi:Fur family peroxide stress response transcriptional regulator